MFHEASRHVANCSVGILDRSTGNGFTGAGVASHEPCQQDNRLMSNLGTAIGRQNINEVHHRICDAKRLGSASLTGESMQRDIAYRGYWIAESTSKSVPGSIARVVIQKEQAQSPHRQIGMVERCGLHSANGHLVDNAGTPILRQRRPPMHEVSGELEVRSCHGERELRL
jgi:hypothetical protein